jgi:hypothetical protein
MFIPDTLLFFADHDIKGNGIGTIGGVAKPIILRLMQEFCSP